VRVLDFTRVLSGPFATMVLADLGADVVKIERPGSGDETRGVVRYEGRTEQDEDYFYVANRNKRSLTLDLKNPAGNAAARRLAAGADVLVENFSGGVMERLGLDDATLRPLNPGLIYCSISGFGQVGPYRDHKSYDGIIQAMAGVMSVTGERDGPPLRTGIMIGDLSGALYGVIGILAALRERERSGLGQVVDVSLFASLISLLTVNAAEYLANGRVPSATGSDNPNRSPARAFRAGDGRHLQLMAATPNLWAAFCRAAELTHLMEDERFRTHQDRLAHREELSALIEKRLRERTRDDWVKLLNDAGVPCGPVNSLDEVFADPQVVATSLLTTVEHPRSGPIRQVAPPLRLSRTGAAIRSAPPLLGADTDAALADWAEMTADEVEALRARGAFG
jgi:formyl-CoA transferase/CoA:oxalate CoA-transferase